MDGNPKRNKMNENETKQTEYVKKCAKYNWNLF